MLSIGAPTGILAGSIQAKSKRVDMKVSQLIQQGHILAPLRAANKKQALQEIAQHAAKNTNLSAREIFDTLIERERLGSTGVGDGVAIPHGRFDGLKEAVGFFALAPKAIEFESIDQEPVDIIFTLLAPKDSGADHLRSLAGISRLLRDKRICAKLRGTQDVEAIFALLTTPEDQQTPETTLSKAS